MLNVFFKLYSISKCFYSAESKNHATMFQNAMKKLKKLIRNAHHKVPMTDQVLDEETWPQEAEAAINDIRKHVKNADVSKHLKNNNQKIYINLTTLEDAQYCVEMSGSGYRVVGRKHDDATLSAIENMNYETPYALLNSISQKYRESFGGELMNKLLDLAKNSDR